MGSMNQECRKKKTWTGRCAQEKDKNTPKIHGKSTEIKEQSELQAPRRDEEEHTQLQGIFLFGKKKQVKPQAGGRDEEERMLRRRTEGRDRMANRERNKKIHAERGNIKMVVAHVTPHQRCWPKRLTGWR